MSDVPESSLSTVSSAQSSPLEGPHQLGNAESAFPPSSPPLKSCLDEDLFSQGTDNVPWIIKGFLARGTLSLLVGSPKLGKTTLAYELIESVALGQGFLGQEVTAAKVLLLGLEEHKRDIIARLRGESGESLKGRVKVEFGPLSFSSQILKEMETYIEKEQIGLVIVDTIPAWWGLEDENDASEVLREGFLLLNTIRRTDAAWLGLGHTRKSGGVYGQDIRGSSALAGLVDIAFSMKRTESGGTQRLLEAVSRYVDTPEKLVLAYQAGGYRVLGTPDAVSAEGKARQVLDVLCDIAQTSDELVSRTNLSKQDISRAVLFLGDQVEKEGGGHRGNPYKYRKKSICPSQSSEGEGWTSRQTMDKEA